MKYKLFIHMLLEVQEVKREKKEQEEYMKK